MQVLSTGRKPAWLLLVFCLLYSIVFGDDEDTCLSPVENDYKKIATRLRELLLAQEESSDEVVVLSANADSSQVRTQAYKNKHFRRSLDISNLTRVVAVDVESRTATV